MSTSDDLYARYGPMYRWLVTTAALLAFFVMVFASSMVNVAIPNVMGTFGVGQDKAQFLTSAFLATNVASLLANTWLIARFGQPIIFHACIIIFVIGSFISTFSLTLDMIIFGRIVQGFGAGVIQPLIMVLLFSIFRQINAASRWDFSAWASALRLAWRPHWEGVVVDFWLALRLF